MAYLMLFGPLVLFPQVATGSGGILAAGLELTALPAGFGVAAVAAERLLPMAWLDRRRCGVGAVVATVAALGLMLPEPTAVRVGLLGLLGVGLGVYIPANNAGIMAGVPAGLAATTGGMLNMARGVGTAGGVAAVTVALHLTRQGGGDATAQTAAGMAVLAIAGMAALWSSRAMSSAPHVAYSDGLGPPRP